MTQEQYNRAVAINTRISELKRVENEIKDTSKHILTYCRKDGYKPCYQYTMAYIADILDRHDSMIREEIDAEIEKLKREIEEL